MKQTGLFTAVLLVLFSMAFSTNGVAQCTPVTTYTQPGLYPDSLPDGTVAQFYSEDITFVLPLDTQGFAFTNFEIQSITGMPFGLSWQCNNTAGGCNYDPAVSQYGCVNFSGVPLLAGTYTLDVLVIASLGVLGDFPTHYYAPLTINPDTTSNSGFSMTNAYGCLPIVVDFNNNNPGLLAYNWNFGNGTQSTAENPSPQIYTQPGNYVVTYAAFSDTVPLRYLTEVVVLGIPNSWGWPADLDPDLFFELKDASGTVIFTSTEQTNTNPPATWAVPNVLLNDETYTVHVWDEDGGVFGGDDDLGTTTFYGWGSSGASVTGSTSITYAISEVGPFPVASSTDTVYVFGYPSAPNIDSTGLYMWTDSVNLSLQWYQNGNVIPGADSANYTATTSGDYWVISTSPAGCYASSDTLQFVICDSLFQPAISQNGHTLFTDSTSYDLQWYFNGSPISGEINQFIIANNSGDYSVTATSFDGCVYTSPILNVDFTGLGEFVLDPHVLNVYPNPSKGQFTMELSLDKTRTASAQITDATGRVVWTKSDQFSTKSRTSIDLSQQDKGMYFLHLSVNGQSIFKKLVVQ